MSNAVATIPNGSPTPDIMYDVIAKGDLSKLSAEQKASYYVTVCESMGLNPTTKPFEYLDLGGKTVLYATRTAADQLRKINGVSLEVVSEQTTPDGIRMVRVRATDKTGRSDEEIGAVNVKGLGGEFLANAYMKAMTKAKRRATLSVCGLGWLDESEVETIPGAQRVPGPEITASHNDTATVGTVEVVDMNTGEITAEPGIDLGTPVRVTFAQRIDAATSLDEIVVIGEDVNRAVAAGRLTSQERKDLKPVYDAKKAEYEPQLLAAK